jgi:Cu/Ag efflux pump CusA
MRYCNAFFMGNSLLLRENLLIPFLVSSDRKVSAFLPNVDGIQQIASQIQNVLSGLPQVRSVFSEKVAQGFYVNVDVNREEAARYGLTIADVQTAVSSGIGGQNITENIERRERYPINVRYQRDFRDNVEKMQGVKFAALPRLDERVGDDATIEANIQKRNYSTSERRNLISQETT